MIDMKIIISVQVCTIKQSKHLKYKKNQSITI